MQIQSKLEIIQWDESPIHTFVQQRKISTAKVEYALTGDITGNAKVHYQMFYHEANDENHPKSRAQYIGLLVIYGDIQGKTGCFILKDEGTIENAMARSSLIIIPNSGLNDFVDIQGSGTYTVSHTDAYLDLTISL